MNASAQSDAPWREFRREDVGFRLEFPGEPAVEEEANETQDDEWMSSISATLDVSGLLLGVAYNRFRAPVDPATAFELQRSGFAHMGAPIQREIDITIDGVAGREYFHGAEGFGYRARVVVVGDAVIAVTAIGDEKTPQDAMGERFMGSFRLFAGKR